MAFFSRKNSNPTVAEATPQATPKAELPDSTSPVGTCTRCSVKSSFSVVARHGITHSGLLVTEPSGHASPHYVEQVSVLLCRHCDESVIVLEELWVGEQRWSAASRGGPLAWRGFFWWPLPASKLTTDAPDSIKDSFAEAGRCLAAGCPRASAVMARRTLEAICADQGVSERTLSDSLAVLSKSGKLIAALADWSREVRLVGNKGAHYDALENVASTDVAQLLSFLTELCKYFYEMPAELKRRRESSP
jgi:hypothetical protein